MFYITQLVGVPAPAGFLCAASRVALHFRFQTAETFKRFAKLLDLYFLSDPSGRCSLR